MRRRRIEIGRTFCCYFISLVVLFFCLVVFILFFSPCYHIPSIVWCLLFYPIQRVVYLVVRCSFEMFIWIEIGRTFCCYFILCFCFIHMHIKSIVFYFMLFYPVNCLSFGVILSEHFILFIIHVMLCIVRWPEIVLYTSVLSAALVKYMLASICEIRQFVNWLKILGNL